MINDGEIIKGRGAQIRGDNKFLRDQYVKEFLEGIDETEEESVRTKAIAVFPKSIVNPINSPDLNFEFGLNPYQGCEHGCVYCYARNSHMYWGYEPALDFESKILYKPNAPELLEKFFQKKNWKPKTIMLSGNTDCYQPLEAKMQLTRSLLGVFLKYRNPLGMITKNDLIRRDIDLLSDLAELKLVRVMISITTLDEKLRRRLEPRTSRASLRLKSIEELTKAGVPTGVMIAPIIPGLNSHEIIQIARSAADAGALNLGHTVVRLNGSIAPIFVDWLEKHYPNKKSKVVHQIEEMHNGKLNDSNFGRRMKGSGNVANMIQQMIDQSKKSHFFNKKFPEYDFSVFTRPSANNQLSIF